MKRVAFDIGGVLSKYPDLFRPLVACLISGGVEVYVITDMRDKSKVLQTLEMNGFGMIDPDRVFTADYDTHGEGCKAVLLEDLKIDMFFDDFVGYVVEPVCPVRLLVMPDASKPYWAESWKTPDQDDFGRRCFKREAKR